MFAAGLQLADFVLRMVGIFPGGPLVTIQSFYFMGHTFRLHAAGHVQKKKKNAGGILEFDIVPKVQVLRDLRTCVTPHPWMATQLHFECVSHRYFILIFK